MRAYFAVICNAENFGALCKHPASVTGTTKEEVIDRAIMFKQEMESRGNGPYQIFVGTITEKVLIRPHYDGCFFITEF